MSYFFSKNASSESQSEQANLQSCPNPCNKYKLGIFGATGRLGKMIGSLALEDPFWSITASLGRSSYIGKDYGCFLGKEPLGLLIASSPEGLAADVWIDVSLPEELTKRLNHNKPMVIGTTGLSEQDLECIHKASRSAPIFYSSNFSLGMALLKKMAADLALLFSKEADIHIIEAHYAGKKDAPSGSALHLARSIQAVKPEANPTIHSIRSGQIVGEHTVQYNSAEEKITLFHQVHSRKAFAEGALEAARFLIGKPAGLYTMEELLAEKYCQNTS